MFQNTDMESKEKCMKSGSHSHACFSMTLYWFK